MGQRRILAIRLPEDNSCTHPDSRGYCHCAIRTSGDSLDGEVGIFAPNGEKLRVEMRLQGYVRTWAGNYQDHSLCAAARTVAEYKFLDQVDLIEHRPVLSSSREESCKPHVLHFSFVIPSKLITNANPIDERFLDLLPSSEQGISLLPALASQKYMQPLITYTLSANLLSADQNQRDAMLPHAREIRIVPTIPARPPAYIDATGSEYRCENKVHARRSIFARSEGDFHFHVCEPAPINLLEQSPKATTTIPIKMAFKPSQNRRQSTDPRSWTLCVRTVLRRRQFYSTKRLGQEPSFLEAQRSLYLRCSDVPLQSEDREYRNLQWRVENMPLHDGSTNLVDDIQSWATEIPAVVAIRKSMLPSYLSPLAALRYTITLSIYVVGFHSSHATLEVPVQVIRDPGHFTKPVRSGLSVEGMDMAHDVDLQVGNITLEERFLEEIEAPPEYRRSW